MNVSDIRNLFPILDTEVHGHPLVYLDNAATTQKPQAVIDALTDYYSHLNANIHRGAHHLATVATERYEEVRWQVQRFIGAGSHEEIVFTRGTTESINLVASSFAKRYFTGGDEVIVSGMEHHSNIVPWQLAGATLRPVPFSDEGVLDLETYRRLFNPHTRLVAVTHVSNTLGTVNPVKEMIDIAHAHGVPVLVDGAQAVSHLKVDVQALGCDFYCFSGHKMYAPMGVGVLYGRKEMLSELPPYQGGGEMIATVSFEKTTFERPPLKFEAGTPDYVATTGLARAIDYLNALGMENIMAYEQELTRYAMEQLGQIEGMVIYGPTTNHDAVISFNVASPHGGSEGGLIHHMDMGTLLDRLGIAVRTGHHCAQPLMDRLGILGTVRASFALYNTKDEVDQLVAGIRRVSQMF